MLPRNLISLATTLALIVNTSSSLANTSNPFLQPSPLPFQAPPFDKIKDSDYQPALEEGMRQQLKEVEDIANNPEPATFENTLVALEKSGALLNRVQYTFHAMTSANTNPTLQKLEEEIMPQLVAHQDAIYLNQKLFQRIQTIYQQLKQLNLDPEAKRLVEVTYHDFIHAGAQLSAANKRKLKALNKTESELTTLFSNQLLEATNLSALVVDDASKLAGLSSEAVATAAQTAQQLGKKNQYVLTLQNTTQQPLLQNLDNRTTRHALFSASWKRAENKIDTRPLVARIA